MDRVLKEKVCFRDVIKMFEEMKVIETTTLERV